MYRLSAKMGVLVAVLVTAGCFSSATTPMGGARTLPDGETAFGGGVGAAVTASGDVTPQADVALRTSVGSRADFGVRLLLLGSPGLQLQPRFAIERAPSPTEGVDVAIAPAADATMQTLFGSDFIAMEPGVGFTLPVLCGINTESVSWLIGVHARENFYPDESQNAHAVMVGGRLGATIRTSDKFRVSPTIIGHYPAHTTAHGDLYWSARPALYMTLGFWTL